MANKHLLFRAAARDKILHGATALTDAGRVTLGPRSRYVLIEKKWGKPIVCNDGVTIAKEIELKDPEENVGAGMIWEAAENQGAEVEESQVDRPLDLVGEKTRQEHDRYVGVADLHRLSREGIGD